MKYLSLMLLLVVWVSASSETFAFEGEKFNEN
jgi:hypothetical protein